MRYVNASSRRLRLAGRNLIIMARSIRRANAAEALTSDDNKDFLKNHFGRKILRQVFGEFSSLTREIGHLRTRREMKWLLVDCKFPSQSNYINKSRHIIILTVVLCGGLGGRRCLLSA